MTSLAHNGTKDIEKKYILAMRIELTRAILMPRSRNLLRNSIIYFRLYSYSGACFAQDHVFEAVTGHKVEIFRLSLLIR